jgi:hypothetical protein
MPDDQFIDALSLPLDSLSLSFADVTTVDDAHTAGAQTVVGSPDDRRVHMHEEETICVEALVVRKQDDWGYGPTEDDGWGFGGDDDGWGFGGDDDGWGFGGDE